ncbi:alpha/beta hydrolase [Naasia lichenicola]|uniref:Alpha/beta hydrolase n=1 Tax=Naasia lichenicola TaxID=2565933 RepID=A0A4S4FL41_9MICO|nr:alpha/beta hydrolase [Naasia lichenicola]THG30888.1 alpha/beta hydrolase [Naasia lichenicola]
MTRDPSTGRPALRRTALRVAASAAVAALTLGLLSACFLAPNPRPTSTPYPEEVTAGLEPYYQQTLVWSGCGDGMQCTTATAPLDWDAPDSADDIELALVRHLASGTPQGSLFINPGGPGASGYDFVHDSLDFAVDSDIQAAFDVVGWDPRGVGRSSAVQCLDGTDLDEYLFGDSDAPVDSPEYVAETTKETAEFVDACTERTGRLLEFVDTASTVHDLDMLRAIVGDRRLNYLGYSYGSDIGAQYADRFPDKVGRLVLDGATDSTLDEFDVSLAQTAAFGDALRAYLTDCLAGSDCPFAGETVDESIDDIAVLLKRLESAPLRGDDGRELNASYLSTAIQSALYSEETWPYLSDAFTEIKAGRSRTAFLLADSYVDRDEDGTYSSNFFEAFIAITCVDYPVETDPAVLAEQRDEIAAADPISEPDDLSALGDLTCQTWPYRFRGQLAPVTGAGAAPIVILGTTGDPATPYQWAQALSTQLESAVLVTYVGEGHLAYDERDPCIVKAVDDYLIRGIAPDDGLTCTP